MFISSEMRRVLAPEVLDLLADIEDALRLRGVTSGLVAIENLIRDRGLEPAYLVPVLERIRSIATGDRGNPMDLYDDIRAEIRLAGGEA